VKKTPLIVLTVFIILTVSTAVNAKTAIELLRDCEHAANLNSRSQKVNRLDAGNCIGFLRGMNATLQLLSGKLDKPYYCVPDSVNTGQTVNVVVNYLRKHPERKSDPDLAVAILALKEAYPCGWKNSENGFRADFPTPPKRKSASSTLGTSYAYQSTKKFSAGGALYAITVTPLPSEIKKDDHSNFLVASNTEFAKNMRQTSSGAKAKWGKCANGLNCLIYRFDYSYSKSPFTAFGFWIINKNRIIRVSVSFSKYLSKEEVREVASFVDSFALLAE